MTSYTTKGDNLQVVFAVILHRATHMRRELGDQFDLGT